MLSIIIDNFEEDCELLSFDYIKIYDYDFKLNNLHNKIKKNYIQRNDFIRNTLENGNGFLWNKVYRNQIIENNNLTFQDNISICEDLLFNIQYARYLTKEVHISFTGYGYYQSLNSSFNKVNNLKWFSVTKAFEIIEKELSNISIDLLIFAYYEHLYIDCEAIARNEINYIKYKGIDDIKQNIKKNFFRVILSNKINIKKKIKCIIFFVFPKITFKYKKKKMKGV